MPTDSVQDILSRLIEFETVSASSNLDIIEYIEDLLSMSGVVARRVLSADGAKSSLLATIGDPAQPGVVLSAHTDVVPAAGQAWSVPAFRATCKDGRIYGRGATDMKGFLATVLAHVPAFVAAGGACPLHLAFSYDEEVGCKGAPDLVAALVQSVAPPALALVGEPTRMRVVRAHKGKVARRLTITGRGGHSAMPHRAANAVEAAAALAVGLRALARTEAAGSGDPAFDPPYTSVHVGSLHGGTALNLVPDSASLEYEIRYLPGSDPAPLSAAIHALIAAERESLRAQADEADILSTDLSAYPALDTPADSAAARVVAELAQDTASPTTVAFGTEAGLYAAAGIPTLVCGPGDMARGHKADEWIGLDELAAATAMMDRLAQRLRRPAGEWI